MDTAHTKIPPTIITSCIAMHMVNQHSTGTPAHPWGCTDCTESITGCLQRLLCKATMLTDHPRGCTYSTDITSY